MAQLIPLLLTVSCFSKIQIGFTFLVSAQSGSPRKRTIKWMCVCVCIQLPTSAVNVTLLAFAAEHDLPATAAVAPMLLSADHAAVE